MSLAFRTTARITAFNPGAPPPPVSIPIRMRPIVAGRPALKRPPAGPEASFDGLPRADPQDGRVRPRGRACVAGWARGRRSRDDDGRPAPRVDGGVPDRVDR